MKDYFKKYFEYNRDVNIKFILFLEEIQLEENFPVTEMSHLLAAHRVWLSRVESEKIMINIWESVPVAEMKRVNEACFNKTINILENHELQLQVNYTNSKGEQFSNELSDVFYHLLNHSNYHRARVANYLRTIGFTPPNSDYIFYVRENN